MKHLITLFVQIVNTHVFSRFEAGLLDGVLQGALEEVGRVGPVARAEPLRELDAPYRLVLYVLRHWVE